METDNFTNWLQKELDKRGWIQADLARKSGAKTASISRIMTGARKVGTELAQSIASALDLPAVIIYEKAGLLPKDHKPHRIQDDIIAYRIREFTDSQADEMIDYIELIKKKDERQRQTELEKSHTNETREVKAPPERLKKAKIIDYLKK